MTNEKLNDAKADIIPAELAIEAMRDSGYSNTSFALAELIDNSVQANANSVEVYCLQEYRVIHARKRPRITTIAVLDDGCGMTPEVLQIALQFGNGTRLQDRRGIGRFGMGLPNSSISQCRRVEIWTWQQGPDNAMYTYLDVDEIKSGELKNVPTPTPQSLPTVWQQRSDIVNRTGTLVVWSNLEEHRLTWKSSEKTWEHTEKVVGRIYRKFIDEGKLQISLVAITDNSSAERRYVRANDPLYLMSNSSTPKPFDDEPMFQTWGNPTNFSIELGGERHDIVVRMSYSKQKAVPTDGTKGGDKPYGKHAAQNVGVSIVRANRELQLDDSWTIHYDTTERWWGAEVEFPPSLDEIFGVTNNKQRATKFCELAKFEYKSEFEFGESTSDYLERVKAEGDPIGILLPIKLHIDAQLKEIRRKIKDQRKVDGTGGDERHQHSTTEDKATAFFRKRQQTGHETESDRELFSEEHREKLVENLRTDKAYPVSEAEKIAKAVLKKRQKVRFFTKAMDGYAFFKVEPMGGGLTAIVFNEEHPFYEQIIGTLEYDISECTEKDLLDKLDLASTTIKLLFTAWARYEVEEGKKDGLSFDEIKQEWGKLAKLCLLESID